MTDVYFRGPDVLRLLSDLGVNSFKTFAKKYAGQFVAYTYDGYVIGDAILFGLDDEEFSLVGLPPSPRTGWRSTPRPADTTSRSSATSAAPANQGQPSFDLPVPAAGPQRPQDRREGRAASPSNRIKFFNIGEFTIAGCTVKALNHHHVRHPRPGDDRAGDDGPVGARGRGHGGAAGSGKGIRPARGRQPHLSDDRPSSPGGIPSPLASTIYTGEQMKPFREWLSEGQAGKANASIGGSFASGNIEDYYLTPWDSGTVTSSSSTIDFIGRIPPWRGWPASRTSARSGCAGTTTTSRASSPASLFGGVSSAPSTWTCPRPTTPPAPTTRC